MIFFAGLFIICEIGCRIFIDHEYFKRTNLYNQVNANDTIDYIFIGSSRTAASIVPEVFSNSSHEISINAGRGYSTAQVHYRALRYLVRRNQNALRNCAVFLEAPSGICYTERGEEWIFEGNTQLLIPYIDRNDLFEFLRDAKDPGKTKIDVVLLYYSAAWRDCFFVREKTDNLFKYHLAKLDMIFNIGESGQPDDSDLTGKGGIKQDSVSIKAVRKFAYEVVSSDIKKQTLISHEDMDNSMLAKISQLVTDAGGQVYLFDTPLSTVIHKIYETDVAVASKMTFDQWIHKNGIPVIKARFYYTDEDFPDLFHLKESRAEEFTDSLMIAYKTYVYNKPISGIIND